MQPTTLEQLQAAVRSHNHVFLRGAGTKSPAAMQVGTIDLSKLSGITEYSPEECVFTAWAGTPLRDIDLALRAHGQYLPFDPPLVAVGATIGGTVAAGLSGSGRYRYGGIRDFLIGTRSIDGAGDVIRSGGKVVKNAAGFLLHHALVGSAGHFGAIAEVTFKVFPLPAARATLEVQCGSLAAAFATARVVEATRYDCEAVDFDTAGTLWVRLAGRVDALRTRLLRLQNAIGGRAIEDDEALWAGVREFTWTHRGAVIKSVDRDHTAVPARFICAGAASWIDGDALMGVPESHSSPDTRAAGLTRLCGVVVRGQYAGARLGGVKQSEFEIRVRRALDPLNKFHAAPDPDR